MKTLMGSLENRVGEPRRAGLVLAKEWRLCLSVRMVYVLY